MLTEAFTLGGLPEALRPYRDLHWVGFETDSDGKNKSTRCQPIGRLRSVFDVGLDEP